ncbi:outer-membrane lipoprotein LolB [Lysobacter xinjiangensis]|uniref:Outer-membrane lipoprotein LolB n=1 Tax=Cognatilysobacter xinjiangensis TaxID=546892 RepID=A0ABQ3C628_9GAMM|nr:lipoprotein insertase outer membrane protein LolB [Lysobacter xinjiangensis]GGZ66909.1 outer-membrane lipoprotein LolB [Lysobacter xinjiangensis]
MSRFRTRVAALLAAGLLAGCATARIEAPAVPAAEAEARQLERERTMAADTDWGFEGRVAISNARDAGSGRLEWRQSGARFEVSLTAPITRQGWRLSGGPGGATLDGLPGGPREGGDAEALLREATGWEIPVRSLPYWVRGLRTDPRGAVLQFGPGGRPSRLSEGGWTIDYSWPADAQAELPSRVEARRDDARVRLVVDRWTDGAEAP